MTLEPIDIARHAIGIDEPRPLSEISRLARMASAGVIPEAIRKCRRLAPAIGASGFALFFAGGGVGKARLLPCFDEAFPSRSPVSATLIANGADSLSQHAMGSCLPGFWTMSDSAAAPDHSFFVRLPKILDDRRGIVLPVSADPVYTGVFVFTGPDLRFAQEAIYDLHRDCFEMFLGIAQLKSTSASSASSISKRELECLKLTAAGRTSEDIARILGLSIHTANQYLTTAASKLDAVNRTHAVAKAIRLGLIE